jgi:hypothetical protein
MADAAQPAGSLRAILQQPDFRKLWLAQFVSVFGDFLALFGVISLITFRWHGNAVQVTFVGPHNIVFRVVDGTFQIRAKPYSIDIGHWRGDYNRDTHTSVYQGPATAPDGRQGYFVLFGADTGSTNTGVYMHIVRDFRGEYGALWHVDINAFRSQLI